MCKLSFSLLCIVMMLGFTTQGCAMSQKNSDELTTITGTIRVVGHEPFTHLVLTVGDNPEKATRDQDYLIIGPLEEELRRHYQWRKVTLEGIICSSTTPEFAKCFNPVRIIHVEYK